MVALQKEVFTGFGLFARLQSVLHSNSNVLTFEAGGFTEVEVLKIGRTTNIITKAKISSANIIIITVETGSSCPFIQLLVY